MANSELERNEIEDVSKAFDANTAVLRQSLKLFVRLAIGVPVVLVLVMVLLSLLIVQVLSSSSRIAKNESNIRLQEIDKVIREIRQTQTIYLNVEAGRTRNDNVRDVLKKNGEIE